MISKFLFNFINFCVVIWIFLTKLLTFAVLFSTAVNAEVVAKPLILGVLPSISVILALKSVFLMRPLVSGILFLIFDLFASYLLFKPSLLVSTLLTLATNLSYTVF